MAPVRFYPAAAYGTFAVWSLRAFKCVTPVLYPDSCISQWPACAHTRHVEDVSSHKSWSFWNCLVFC